MEAIGHSHDERRIDAEHDHRRTHFYTNVRPGGFARQQHPGQQGGGGQQTANPLAQILAFLPVLLLLAFTFFSSQSEPVRGHAASIAQLPLCPSPCCITTPHWTHSAAAVPQCQLNLTMHVTRKWHSSQDGAVTTAELFCRATMQRRTGSSCPDAAAT